MSKQADLTDGYRGRWGMDLFKAISTVGGLGYFPYAPGTIGSAAGLVFCVLLKGNPTVYFLAFIAVFFLGVVSSGKMEKHLKMKDPSCVVIDEFAGMFIVFFAVPITILSVFLGFALFRLFDVLKPPPIKYVEKRNGGWGIMLDDVMAGFFAWLFLRGFLFLLK
jgi:phosphatidylglycerophosphatase A